MGPSREELAAALGQAFEAGIDDTPIEAAEVVIDEPTDNDAETEEQSIETEEVTEEAKAEKPADEEQTDEEVDGEQDEPTDETEAEEAEDAPESFTKLDPNELPAEVLPFYRSMLGDYTRKMQETAPLRKTIEAHSEGLAGFFEGKDLTPAQQASEVIGWAIKVNSDPQAALAYHKQLSSALAQQGLLDADEVAAEDTDEVPTGESEALSRIAQLEAQIAAREAEAKAAAQAAEEQARQTQEVELIAQEWEAVKASPDFSTLSQGTWDVIAKTWIAEGGPMVEIAQRVKSEIEAQAKALAEEQTRAYLQRKKEKQAPTAAGPTGVAAQPQATRPATIEEANERAKAALEAAFSRGI